VRCSLLEESISLFNDRLLDGDWTAFGEASLHREIGESYKFLEDWNEAEIAHRVAIKLYDNPLDRIHLAEALLYQRKIDDACGEIDQVESTALTGPALEDYSLACAIIAIWSGKRERLESARVLLEAYDPKEPYFRERRLKLLLSVNKGISEGKIPTKEKEESAPKGGFLSILAKFIMIQPNIAGIGINVNAIIDELAKRKEPSPNSPGNSDETKSK